MVRSGEQVSDASPRRWVITIIDAGRQWGIARRSIAAESSAPISISFPVHALSLFLHAVTIIAFDAIGRLLMLGQAVGPFSCPPHVPCQPTWLKFNFRGHSVDPTTDTRSAVAL
jgi:hypothetical protein